MTQEQIIADYKKARHITDEYVLDEDEMYFVEQIYFLHQEQVKNCSIPDVSYCATQMKNVLCNRFTNEAKKHVGEKINEVPELAEMLKAIEIVEKHCS